MHPNERLDSDRNERLDGDPNGRFDSDEVVVDAPDSTRDPIDAADDTRDREAAPATDVPSHVPSNGNGDGDGAVELLKHDDVETFRGSWQEIQTRFVDDPQAAVRDADSLVSDVLDQLSTTFTDRKRELESHWQQGADVETEALRQALRRYRSFFDRLLNA